MKITRPSLKRSGFVITPSGCRFGKVPFMIYRKRLYPLLPKQHTTFWPEELFHLFFELIGVDEISNKTIGLIQTIEKKADELGIILLEPEEFLNEYLIK